MYIYAACAKMRLGEAWTGSCVPHCGWSCNSVTCATKVSSEKLLFSFPTLSLIINYYFSTPLPVLAAYYYLLVSSVLTLYHICNIIIMIDLWVTVFRSTYWPLLLAVSHLSRLFYRTVPVRVQCRGKPCNNTGTVIKSRRGKRIKEETNN